MNAHESGGTRSDTVTVVMPRVVNERHHSSAVKRYNPVCLIRIDTPAATPQTTEYRLIPVLDVPINAHVHPNTQMRTHHDGTAAK